MKKIIMSIMAAFLLFLPINANAKDFYEGKVITIIVGSGTGGGLSLNAQLLSKYMGKYIPGNPRVIVTYKSGAGGVKLANFMARENRANDGTTIGMFIGTTLMSGVVNKTNVHFDLDSFSYLGGIVTTRSALMVKSDLGVKTMEDARNIEVVMGSTSKRSQTSVLVELFNQALGTKFKVVTGYKGTGPILAAMERNEVGGVSMTFSTIETARPQWIDDGFIDVLAFSTPPLNSPFSGAPRFTDLVTDPLYKKAFQFMDTTNPFGRAFLVSKDVPSERVAILRKAFEDTMNDPEFRAFAASRKFPVDPVSWQALEAEIEKMKSILTSTPEVIETLRGVMGIK